ncbi:hypothetical protein TW73_10840 [Pseudoalteromonas piscicida]|nr:hypothetical protein TW73_10840 [Pseudoalteromonas piscicida]
MIVFAMLANGFIAKIVEDLTSNFIPPSITPEKHKPICNVPTGCRPSLVWHRDVPYKTVALYRLRIWGLSVMLGRRFLGSFFFVV